MSNPGLRIECPDNLHAHKAKVFYVARDGTEVDISDAIQAVDLRAEVGDVVRARIECTLVGATFGP